MLGKKRANAIVKRIARGQNDNRGSAMLKQKGKRIHNGTRPAEFLAFIGFNKIKMTFPANNKLGVVEHVARLRSEINNAAFANADYAEPGLLERRRHFAPRVV